MSNFDKLVRAIAIAQDPGSCKYASPCVVGAVFKIEGYTTADLKELDDFVEKRDMAVGDAGSTIADLPQEHVEFLTLRGYNIDALEELQFAWDDGNPHDMNETRKATREELEKLYPMILGRRST